MRRSDAVFLLGGAAALIEQLVWARLLGRLLGSDAAGFGLVLAIFMAGLGAGALLGAAPAQRAGRPARLYAALELACGLWAALSPLLIGALEPVQSFGARAGLAALVLLPPTLCMGAGFPLMGRLCIEARASFGARTASFYGANTLGAALGALLGSFALVPFLGFRGALYAGALVQLAAAALALGLRAPAAATSAPASAPRAAQEEPSPASSARRALPYAFAAAALGCSSLALEVLLARLLAELIGTSTYAYAIVLALHLFGLGFGSRLASAWLAGRLPAREIVLRCALALPLASFAGLCALRWQLGGADLCGGLINRLPPQGGILVLWALFAVLSGLVLLPPAIALGAALPAAAAAWAHATPGTPNERVLGRVYAWNSAGAVAGSLLAAFVLLPLHGLRGALALALVPAAMAALALACAAGPRRWASLCAAWALAGALAFLALRASPPPAGLERVVLAHDRDATVAVYASGPAHARQRTLYVNGNPEASSAPVDQRLQRLLSAIPALVHGDVKRAAVIGLGTGMTAGALLDHAALEELHVYEISRALPHGARAFASENGALLDDARTRLVFADGRHALRTSEQRYDLITSDPIHPWTRGSNDLYALEHFSAMRTRLAPGGIASQWLPLYQLREREVRTVIATWCAAFEHASAWLTAYDLVLLGSTSPLAGEPRLLGDALPARLAASLARVGIHSRAELAALQVAGRPELLAFAAGAAPMRDDLPQLEFRAPFAYLDGYCVEALRWAGRAEYLDALPLEARARGREVRALLERFLAELPQARSGAAGTAAAVERYGDALLALPPLD
jgi:spermidine synthase